VTTTFSIEIDKETAFAVFEFLSRGVYDQRPFTATSREQKALRVLCETLDNELVERFRTEYRDLADQRRGQGVA